MCGSYTVYVTSVTDLRNDAFQSAGETLGLRRYHGNGHVHFITWSCYLQEPQLGTAARRTLSEYTAPTGLRIINNAYPALRPKDSRRAWLSYFVPTALDFRRRSESDIQELIGAPNTFAISNVWDGRMI